MPFKDGDFLEIEYTVFDGEKVISTTDQKRAKEAGIFEEKMQYGPVLIILGSSGVLKGLDRELRDMKPGEPKKTVFKPIDAFGERNEDLVRVMPLSEFRSRDIDPYPGMRVNLDDVTATVKSVNSGRVVVDANHPYAGKDITYDFKIIKVLEGEKERAEALFNSYGVKPTQLSANQEKIELFYNSDTNKNADYFIGKASAIASLFTHFKGVKTVDVKEEYARPKEEKK